MCIKNQRIEEENILLQFKENSYTAMNCCIEYTYIYTDPPFEEYERYLDINDFSYGYFNETTYDHQTDYYEGKIIQYNINIEENLVTDCGAYCELCLEINKDYCITCKEFLKYEYGIGGASSIKGFENIGIEFDSKGIKLYKGYKDDI